MKIRLNRFRKDPTVLVPLSEEDLNAIYKQMVKIEQYCQEYSHSGFNTLMSMAHVIRDSIKEGQISEQDRLRLIAIGRLALLIEFGKYLYSTQIYTLLGLILKGNSRQAQVKTGEGKSMIVALYGFLMAMECRTVDIITSSRYLAVRDQGKFSNFFKRCGISTGHICSNEKTPDMFRRQILYAPAFDFEFAWMEDLLLGRRLFRERLSVPYVTRNFDVVCVDESDNLLIDSARNGARLGFAAEVSYEWIYAPILKFVLKNKLQSKQSCKEQVPALRGYLKGQINDLNQIDYFKLTDQQLLTWLQSAWHASYELKENVDYVIKTKRDDDGNEEKVVQIVDLKTGRISENSRWSNGIHEFLEVKHDIVVQRESLTPITLSHAVFYDFYQTVTALTGTAERTQTKEVYNIESFDVPPHLPLKRIDLPPIIARKNSFYPLMVQKAKEMVAKGRPLLILCPTIEKTNQLAEQMKEQNVEFKLLNEVQEELEHLILSVAGFEGKVTIATNTAGRGTDILLSENSISNGGLFVHPTFYFKSRRDKDQAIGRAGRQGQPGTSQMILDINDPQIQELVKGNEDDFSDEVILSLLQQVADTTEKIEGKTLIALANLERFLAKKNTRFLPALSSLGRVCRSRCCYRPFCTKS